MGTTDGGDEITPLLDNSMIILSDVVVSLFMVKLETGWSEDEEVKAEEES